MKFESAGVAKLVRLHQKDDQFLERYNNTLLEFLRLATDNNLNKIRKYSSYLSQLSYYLLTSISNLQTLGEEYTSIIRFQKSKNDLPSKTLQLLWLLLYIFGKDTFIKIMETLEQKIAEQKQLKTTSRNTLMNICRSLKINQDLIVRFHLTFFYLQKKYYNISNRLTGIEYVSFVRDEKLSNPFNVLGMISLCYLISNLAYNIYKSYSQTEILENLCDNQIDVATSRECLLCAEYQIIATALGCGHYYCWNCVFDLINTSGQCPVCREPIERNSVIMLENF